MNGSSVYVVIYLHFSELVYLCTWPTKVPAGASVSVANIMHPSPPLHKIYFWHPFSTVPYQSSSVRQSESSKALDLNGGCRYLVCSKPPLRCVLESVRLHLCSVRGVVLVWVQCVVRRLFCAKRFSDFVIYFYWFEILFHIGFGYT